MNFIARVLFRPRPVEVDKEPINWTIRARFNVCGQEQTICYRSWWALSVRKNRICFFKTANRALRIERSFQQGFRIPFTPMRWIEEIAAVHVNCAGPAGTRIGDRVNDVVSERRRIPLA